MIDWDAAAVEWRYGDYRIRRTGFGFAVYDRGGLCLKRNGDWDYEPLPSSRAQEWYREARYQTREEAYEAIEKDESKQPPS